MSEGIVVRNCETLEEFHACVGVQRVVWGEADLEVEPATMFVVAAHTGGQVLGAFDGKKLIGYTLAVAGVRNGSPFLHSHMTAVLDGYRDRGVGRKLKHFQRDEALRAGIRLIEWTFDPLETRNAHFNLNRLGAVCRRYLSNLYGITTSPLHRGLPTDRLVAEWYLDSPRVIASLLGKQQEPTEAPLLISLPPELESWKAAGSPHVAEVQSRVRSEFLRAFQRSYAAFAVRNDSGGSSYLLAPWSDF